MRPCGNECCKPEETQEEIYEDKDPLKHVPGDNYGRAMVNKAAHPAVEATDIEDDIFTYQLLMDFKIRQNKEEMENKINSEFV